MCQAQEQPQRRHRAVYLAPSAGLWHQQQQQRQQQQHQGPAADAAGDGGDEEAGLPLDAPDALSELGIPLLLEVPYYSAITVSPPSSGEASSHEFQRQLHHSPPPSVGPPRTFHQQLTDAMSGMYHGFVDFFLLLVVCFMGLFFYDVEVKVVQADRQRTRARGRRGRVIIRTNEQQRRRRQEESRGLMTNLLRTPPRSGNFSWASRSPQPQDQWEHVV